ncbi:Hypothetical protein PHPALM_14898 [Phytophthora palmivora]|uniref:Chromo domain-containing protein n=1 Tax=Phytophthora palmivora TaxID=4796 RepID=A0A2P4XTJ6_9STRA|nr:Hypothetical protein PHPALM_14898 [Phytophthora palmivora]
MFFPVVHVTKLKLVKEYPDRPLMRLTVESQDRLDFDEDLLPGDSWIQNSDPDEYEVEKITDMRSGRRTRYGRIYREFLVHWRGYDDPSWVDEADLNYGALLHEFLRDRTNHNRFGVMQSHVESYWDEIAENLIFAINNLMDATRKETPFYLVHGWDTQSTLRAMTSSLKRGSGKQTDALVWPREVNRQ